jgi:proline iminopeptidase
MDFTRRGAIGAAVAAGLAGCAKPPAPGEGHADVPGGKVWWKRVGAGTKTPILTLHGGPGAGTTTSCRCRRSRTTGT